MIANVICNEKSKDYRIVEELTIILLKPRYTALVNGGEITPVRSEIVRPKAALWIALLSVLLSPMAALAQAKSSAIPANLTVSGKRCWVANFECGKEERNLLLRSSTTITGLKLFSVDLNRSDGAAVLPATAIKATLSKPGAEANQPIDISLQFDFNRVPSGEYSGVLLLTFAEGELTLPVTIRVKDRELWPLLVLLLGVALGVGVSAYRTEGMTNDEIVVQVGRLRSQLRADAELDRSFEMKINAFLIDVETALANKRWDVAQQAANQAQSVWDKWRKSRADWLTQVQYRTTLQQRLEDEHLNAESVYLQVVRSQLEDTIRGTVDFDNPQPLRRTLEEIQQQMNRYLQAEDRLEKILDLIGQLPPEKVTPWQLKVQKFQQDLDGFSPKKLDTFPAWEKQVEAAKDELFLLVPKSPPPAATTPELRTSEGGNVRSMIPNRRKTSYALIKPVPGLNAPEPDPVEVARNRLKAFNWLGYSLTVGLLAGAGFSQLYINRSTFGANGWGDYFSLLAWGFGAEVTRESVTKVVRDWKLPGVK